MLALSTVKSEIQVFGSSGNDVLIQMVLKFCFDFNCDLKPSLIFSVFQDWFSSFSCIILSDSVLKLLLHLNLLEPVSVCNQELWQIENTCNKVEKTFASWGIYLDVRYHNLDLKIWKHMSWLQHTIILNCKAVLMILTELSIKIIPNISSNCRKIFRHFGSLKRTYLVH